jgi:hypothetical protein
VLVSGTEQSLAERAGDQPPGTSPPGIRWVRIASLICGAIALYLLGRLAADMLIEQFGLQYARATSLCSTEVS